MTQAPDERDTAGRPEQIAYDKLGVADRTAGQAWVAAWVKHLYTRDREQDDAWLRIVRWMVSNPVTGHRLGPPLFMVRRQWPVYAIWLFLRDASSFHTILGRTVDESARRYVSNTASGWQAVRRGDQPIPRT